MELDLNRLNLLIGELEYLTDKEDIINNHIKNNSVVYNKDELKEIDINDILRVNRNEDEGNDVWTVFNRIQENLTHDVKDKQTDIWLNQQLYDLAGRELTLA